MTLWKSTDKFIVIEMFSERNVILCVKPGE